MGLLELDQVQPGIFKFPSPSERKSVVVHTLHLEYTVQGPQQWNTKAMTAAIATKELRTSAVHRKHKHQVDKSW